VDVTVGVGAVPGVSAEEVLAAVDAVLPAGARVTALVTLDARAAEPGLAAAVGTASVAEAAALLGGARLVVGKTVHGRVTVAVSSPGGGPEALRTAGTDTLRAAGGR
jgi:cobalamin biosynthesis protein CbiG